MLFSRHCLKRAAAAASAVLCCSFFALQARVTLSYYLEGKTNTAISYVKNADLELPHVTVCPRVPQREHKTMATEEEYMSNSFDLTDIFHPVLT